MVLLYNTEQQAIEARQRIATAEGLPQSENSTTVYHLDYKPINTQFYIDARNEVNKTWYQNELSLCVESINNLPLIEEI